MNETTGAAALTGDPHLGRKPRRRGVIFPTFLLLVAGSIVVSGLVGFVRVSHAKPWWPSFYEQDPPVIEWVTEPPGIGADALSAKLRISDTGGGLDEVVVRLSQRNQPQQLAKRIFAEQHVESDEIEFTINAKDLTLREGKAELEVLAFDRTLWSNATHLVLPLVVDFAKPRIDVITPQQNGVAGGTELVFFKVVGKAPSQQGVEYQGTLYPAFQAKLLDSSFKSYHDLYFAFFPVPIDFSDDAPRMKIMARDDIGNAATANFKYQVRSRRFPTPQTALDLPRAQKITDSLLAANKDSGSGFTPTGSPAKDLALLLKITHLHDEVVLSEAFSTNDGRKWWSQSFGRPVMTLPSSTMGEQRGYSLEGEEFWRATAGGVRFAVPSRTAVQAANAGRISYTGELGYFGKTVIIDHGFGLTSLYAHLSEITGKVGDEVAAAQAIGRTGDSGFSLGEEVYFEIRMHGVPVSPNEWWDATWVSDHITRKIAFVQGTLIGNPGE